MSLRTESVAFANGRGLAAGDPLAGVPTVNLMGNHEATMVDALSELGITHIDMPATPLRIWQTIQAARLRVPRC